MAPGPFDTLSSTTRRGLIGGGLALGALGWFGLRLFRPARASPPDVPEDAIEDGGWVEADAATNTSARSVGPVTLESVATTRRFRDAALTRRIESRPVVIDVDGESRSRDLSSYADGAFADSLRVFAATRIDTSPAVDELPGGLGLEEVLDRVTAEAAARFESELANSGLEGVERTGEGTLDVDTGETATRLDYAGTYAFDGVSTSVGGTDVSLPGEDVDVTGHLAVWDGGDAILVATGVYPDENYRNETTETGDAGREITLSLDLELDPDAYREETLALMRGVA